MTDGKKPIALVGLPGVGKSSIGRRLARRLDRSFVDTDRAIEERLGCTIAELFEKEGEPRFRALERETLAALLTGDDARAGLVVATGGGIVLDPTNRERLRAEAVTVYLRSAPQALLSRHRNDGRRPLLRGDDVGAVLMRLHAERDPLYREVAAHTVDAEGGTVPRLAACIASLVERPATAATR